MNNIEKILFNVNEVIRLSITKNMFGFDVWGTIEGQYFEAVLNPFKEIIDIETSYEDRIELLNWLEERINEGIKHGVFDKEGKPLTITYFN